MDYVPLADNAVRQMIDSTATFDEHRKVAREARQWAGGMYWKQNAGYEYLVRTNTLNKQTSLGRRNAETETIYSGFVARKRDVEARLKALGVALTESERQNKALRVGRVPLIVVRIINALDEAGIAPHFTVVGTHALYAYEAAAGVRFKPGTLATNDVDLLWDARSRVRFIADMGQTKTSMLRLLQTVDPSFRRDDEHQETAINDRAFKVDFLKREPEQEDQHPFAFSKIEGELYPVQARRASVLTQAPRFEQIVVGATGRMALMPTIDPAVFVTFKKWMAEHATDRDAFKRRRDANQAAAVQSLLDEGLLQTAAIVGPATDLPAKPLRPGRR